jgi:ketosteroid isomerase-like protein
MPTLSPDAIRNEVTRFWKAFTDKDVETLENFYAHESVGFGTAATRSEPGRLSATRRQREYFGSTSPIRVQISPVDVVMLDDFGGIASYTFQFQATRTSASANFDEHVKNGRATQVFGFDPDGTIRIFHEHLSVAALQA